MGLSSYMLSTIFGALEFLESQHFRDLLAEKKDQQPPKKNVGKSGQSETKVGTSVPGETNSIELGSQADKREMHTNSLL